MKYAIIDQTTGDFFEKIFETAEQAISEADYEWRIMSDRDKRQRTCFNVSECEVDEYGCVDYNTVNPIKEYK